MTVADSTLQIAAVRHAPRKLASGPSCRAVPTSSRRRSRLRTSTGLVCGHRRARASNAVVARYYDPSTAQFLTRDPLEAETGQPYAYADDDPIDGTDPSGLCSESLNLFEDIGCQTADTFVNIGRGATFGLTDKFDNWVSPGSSCTVAQNSFDEFLGTAAVGVVFGELQAIRASYVAAARAIPEIADSPEEAYQLRNLLKVFNRERTPLPFRWLAQARATEPLAQLLERKGAQGVISGAGRTNPWVNLVLGIW